jgi:peptide/nickel transport system ATP-binding protein
MSTTVKSAGKQRTGKRGPGEQEAGDTPLVDLQSITKTFSRPLDVAAKIARSVGVTVRESTVHAVDRVDLAIRPGEVVGLVGESGCGKSTLGRVVAGLHKPTSGRMLYRGQPVTDIKGAEARHLALTIQMIFQDPMASLNPRLKVAEIIGEAVRVHKLVPRSDLDDYVVEVMGRVGLDPTYRTRYPHQFSGGQRQRIGIARALAVQPEMLVCDEAVAALDVSIQAQVLNLFLDLRDDLGLTYLFISHDLGVVEHLSDRVVIMYLGRVVESAKTEELFADPNHPYTVALLADVPRLEAGKRRFHPIKGEIPSPLAPPPGCHFHPRCPHAHERCRVEAPALKEIAPGRLSACHLNDEK